MAQIVIDNFESLHYYSRVLRAGDLIVLKKVDVTPGNILMLFEGQKKDSTMLVLNEVKIITDLIILLN